MADGLMFNPDQLLNSLRQNFGAPSNNYNPEFNFKPSTTYGGFNSPTPILTDSSYYDLDRIAFQSNFTNGWNSFIQGINETQVSVTKYDYFTAKANIADIEGYSPSTGKLKELDYKLNSRQISLEDYNKQKAALDSELSSLYQSLRKLEEDMAGDHADMADNPVSKRYALKEQLVQSQGNDAALWDQLTYAMPRVSGSSASLAATALTANLGARLAKQVVGRAAAGLWGGHVGAAIGAISGLISFLAPMAYARHLESKAEVGGAVDNAYQELKFKKEEELGRPLSEADPNDKVVLNGLVKQAMEGSDRQYWKNMSLVASDWMQAAILPGVFGRFGTMLNTTNKLTRLGARAGTLAAMGKLEALEEGLQFGFEHEKQQASQGYKPNKNFLESLGGDYVDVLSSMDFGPIRGNGKYGDNKQFQFATDAGFLLGTLMAGPGTILQTAKDVYNYKKTNQKLRDASLLNTEENTLKLKDEVYQQFFEGTPQRSSNVYRMLGFGTEADDRVHYLIEGIKGLRGKKDEEGNLIMSDDEISKELSDIKKAYKIYHNIGKSIDKILIPYGKENVGAYKVAAHAFKQDLFHTTMGLIRTNERITDAYAAHEGQVALTETNPVIRPLASAMAKLEAAEDLLKTVQDTATDGKAKEQRIKDLNTYIKETQEEVTLNLDLAGVKQSDVAMLQQYKDNAAELVRQEMYRKDLERKQKDLSKVSLFKGKYKNPFTGAEHSGLIDWFTGRSITRQSDAEDALFELTLEGAKMYADGQKKSRTKSWADLSAEEKVNRRAQNADILKKAQFTDEEVTAMSEEEADAKADDILEDFSSKRMPFNEGDTLARLATMDAEEFDRMKGKPQFRSNLSKLFPNWENTTFDILKQAAEDRLKKKAEETKKTGKKKPITGNIDSFNGIVGRKKDSSDTRTYNEFLTLLNINNNESTQKEVLEFIIASDFASPQEKQLAKELLSLTKSSDKIIFTDLSTPGLYTRLGSGDLVDQVAIDLRFLSDDYDNTGLAIEAVVLHELIHKYTINSINDNPDLQQRVTELFTTAKEAAIAQGLTLPHYYGLTNEAELLAEGMVSPQFQEFLKRIKFDSKKTYWDKFLELVNQALAALGINTTKTALDELISIVSEAATFKGFDALKDKYQSQAKEIVKAAATVEDAINSVNPILDEISGLRQNTSITDVQYQMLYNAVMEEVGLRGNQLAAELAANYTVLIEGFTLTPNMYIVLQNGKYARIESVGKDKKGNPAVRYQYKDNGGATVKMTVTGGLKAAFRTYNEMKAYLENEGQEAEPDIILEEPVVMGLSHPDDIRGYWFKLGQSKNGTFFVENTKAGTDGKVFTFRVLGDAKEYIRSQVAGSEVSVTDRDIEAKKADIERRRQEELEENAYRIKVKKESRRSREDDGTIIKVVITTMQDGSKVAYTEIDGNRTAPTTYSKDLSNDKIYEASSPNAEEWIDKEAIEEAVPKSNVTEKINAKYDAELALLPNNTSVSEETKVILATIDSIDNESPELLNRLNELANEDDEYKMAGELFDPKTLESVQKVVQAALKDGKNNFVDIMKFAAKHISKDKLQNVYNKMRAGYAFVYAQLSEKGQLIEDPAFLVNLMNNKYTLDDILAMAAAPVTQQEKVVPYADLREENIANRDFRAGVLYKTAAQDFEVLDIDGNKIYSKDIKKEPVAARRRNFLSYLYKEVERSGKTPTDLGFFGLMTKDSLAYPHDAEDVAFLTTKPEAAGEIIVLVDKDLQPIKINDKGEPDANGEVLTMYFESPEKLRKRADKEGDLKSVCKLNNLITYSPQGDEVFDFNTAREMLTNAAENIEHLRAEVKDNKQVLVTFNQVTPGIRQTSKEGVTTTFLIGKNVKAHLMDTPIKKGGNIGYSSTAKNKKGRLGYAYVDYKGDFIELQRDILPDNIIELISYVINNRDTIDATTKEELKTFFRNIKKNSQLDINVYTGRVTLEGTVLTPDQFAVELKRAVLSFSSDVINQNFKEFYLENGELKSRVTPYNDFMFRYYKMFVKLDENGEPLFANAYLAYQPSNVMEIIKGEQNVEEIKKQEQEEVKAEEVITPLEVRVEGVNKTKEEILKEIAERKAKLQKKADNVDVRLRKDEGNITGLPRSIYLENDTDLTVSPEEQDWFKTTLAGVYSGKFASRHMKLVKELINSDSWGLFAESGTILVENAPEGTLYHEAWHEFTQLYLTLKEKKALYNEARKQGESDYQVEERLAEEFRAYALKPRKPKYSIFERILNFIKQTFFGKVSVDVLFDKLYKGEINKYNPSINNIQFKRLNAGIADSAGNELFSNKRTQTLIKTIDKLIYDYIHNVQGWSLYRVFNEEHVLFAAYTYAYKQFIDKDLEKQNQFEEAIVREEDPVKLEKIYAEMESHRDLYDRVINNFTTILEHHKKNSRTFVITEDEISGVYDEAGNIIFEEEGDDTNTEKASKVFDQKAGNEISSIDGANKETRALVRGLARRVDENNIYINEFGFPELVDFAQTWNNLALNLANTYEFDKILVKLDNLKNRYPEYIELLKILNDYRVHEKTGLDKILMLTKFRQDFSRSFVPVYELIYDANTLEYKVDETTKNNFKAIKKLFDDNFISRDENKYIKKDKDGNNYLSPLILEDFNPNGFSNKGTRIKFLDALGITFSAPAIKDSRFDDIVNSSRLTFIYNGIKQLLDANVKIMNPTEDLSNNSRYAKFGFFGETGNLNALIAIESKYNSLNPTASMQNAEGNTVYALQLRNAISTISDYLSDYVNYPTYQDLISEPHLAFLDFTKNPYVKNSIWLNNMFVLDEESIHFGKRKSVDGIWNPEKLDPVVIQIVNFNGLNVDAEGLDLGKTTTRLYVGDKMVQDFTTLLKASGGFKEMMRAGDKSSAFAVKFSSYSQALNNQSNLPIDTSAFKNNLFGGKDFLNIMSGYLFDELKRIQDYKYKKVGTDLKAFALGEINLFRDLLTSETKTSIVEALTGDADINTIINNHAAKLRTELAVYFIKQFNSRVDSFNDKGLRVHITGTDKFGMYQLGEMPKWVSKDLITPYKVAGEVITPTFSQLLRSYIVNAFILNVEQTKIFNGDGAFYKDFHKRNSKDSATKTTMTTDSFFLDWLNYSPNTNLQSKLLGVYNSVSNVINSVIFKDNEVPSAYIDSYKNTVRALLEEEYLDPEKIEETINRIESKYGKNNEGDAQGWITLDFYRTFKLSQGKWSTKHENAYRKIIMSEFYTKQLDTASSEQARKDIQSKIGENKLTGEEMAYFVPVKAQYAGPLVYKGLYAPAFHKFSLVPLIPSLIRGTALEHLNEKMIRSNVGYGLFESGSKVASIQKEVNGKNVHEDFYLDYTSRTPVDRNSTFDTVNPVYSHFLGEQVNIEPKTHSDVIFGTQFRKLLFQNLYNQGEPLDAEVGKLYHEFSDVLAKMIQVEKKRLFKDLGIKEIKRGNETYYEAANYEKLVDTLIREVNRRDLNDNVKRYLEYDKSTGKFKYPLDGSMNRKEIETLLMSLINNRLVRQKMKGDLMIQVASSGFESTIKPVLATEEERLEYGTNGLRTYYLKGGEVRVSEVKVPLTEDFKNLLYFKHTDGNHIGTLERLNEMMRNETWRKEHRKSLRMVGYRIPTQGLNSIESMEVKEFLPEEAGNIIILPTEIVTKAGSDFDIDKLSIFKPSIAVKKKLTLNEKGKWIEEVDTAYYVRYRKEFRDYYEMKDKVEAKYEPLIQSYRNKYDQYMKDLESIYREFKRTAGVGNIENYVLEVQTQIELIKDQRDLLKIELELTTSYAEWKKLKSSDKKYANSLVNLNSELLLLTSMIHNQKALLTEEQIANLESLNLNMSKSLQADLKSLLSKDGKLFKERQAVQKKFRELILQKKEALREALDYKNGLQNRVIEIADKIMTDDRNFIQVITPNDTFLIKPLITDKGGIKDRLGFNKVNYTGTNIYTEATQEEKFQAGLVGKKALGIAAITNTYMQLFQKVKLHINRNYTNIFKDEPSNHTVHHYLLPQEYAGIMRDASGRVVGYDLSQKYDAEGELKSEFASQMINAYVDVLNDDFIFYGNAGLDVAPVLFYLKNVGVPTKTILHFINHPVIRAYIAQTQASKSIVLETINHFETMHDIGETEQGVVSKLLGTKESVWAIVGTDDLSEYFNGELLNQRIDNKLSEIPLREKAAILAHYLELKQQAEMLRKLQASTNFDTNTFQTPIDADIQVDMKGMVKATKMFNNEALDRITGETVIKGFNVSKVVNDIFEQLLPVTGSKFFRSQALRAFKAISKINFEIDQNKVVKTFTNDFLLYLLTKYSTVQLGNQEQTLYSYVMPMFAYNGHGVDNRLASKLIKFKADPVNRDLINKYPLIQNLKAEYFGNLGNIKLTRQDNSSEAQNSFIEQFEELIRHPDSKVRTLFKNIALFSIFQSGVTKSPISFTDIIPSHFYTTYMLKAISKYNKLNEGEKQALFQEFFGRFYVNNLGLYGEVASVPSYRFKNYGPDVMVVTPKGNSTQFFNDQDFLPPVQGQLFTNDNSSIIYSKLGDKTVSGNVKLESWSQLKDAKKAFTDIYGSIVHIISTRIHGSNEHFGNPFSHDPAGKTQGLIKTNTIKEAVQNYIDWLTTNKFESVQPGRRQWIINQLKSENLKDKPILYFKELGEPSHATALDYLINKYDWNNNSITINKQELYTQDRLDKALGTQNTFMSNFHQLENPIIDEFGNQYWNSEGYYMALRTQDQSIKKEIAQFSKQGGQVARNARSKYSLDMHENNRLEYMRKAIKAKFDNNPRLRAELLSTGNKEIIEKNYWKDDLFGVRIDTRQGANILGKLLMEYRSTIPGAQKDLFKGDSFKIGGQQNEVEVNYKLKIVRALNHPKTKSLFTKFFKNNSEKFYNELYNLGVGKPQVEYLQNWANQNNPQSVEDLIIGIQSEFAYTIEIETTGDRESLISRDNFVIVDQEDFLRAVPYTGVESLGTYDFGYGSIRHNDKYYFLELGEGQYGKIEKIKAKQLKKFTPSNYYDNLTVPGGINYREHEIKTPEINFSIKGHARFSTHEGIGWFRTDDKEKATSDRNYYKRYLESGLYKGEYTAYEDVTVDRDFNKWVDNKKKEDDLFDSSQLNTRRILEMQSDLFQKGRNKEFLIDTPVFTVNKGEGETWQLWKNDGILKQQIGTYDTDAAAQTERVLAQRQYEDAKQSENLFIQLLNKDNNWITFFIKAIIQDSTKKGYDSILFPQGDTASKVEGHETLESFKLEKEKAIKNLEEIINNGGIQYEVISMEDGEPYDLYNTLDEAQDVQRDLNSRSTDFGYNIVDRTANIEDLKREIEQYKAELTRLNTEGFTALKPIHNFYQTIVYNILKKHGYNPTEIKDEHNNGWYEVKIQPFFKDDIYFIGSSNQISEERSQDYQTGDIVEYKGDYYEVQFYDEPELKGTEILELLEDNIDPRDAWSAKAGINKSILSPLGDPDLTPPIFGIPHIIMKREGAKVVKTKQQKDLENSEEIRTLQDSEYLEMLKKCKGI